ncbi:MAG: AAA family ATPase [Oscillatoria sp. SIO1A7]|nr:AAA family ATPase [Oscillatoria sp. SIO1A7]
MSSIFRGFEELLELAKTLEERIEQGEIKTAIQVNSVSSIPRAGSIPRRSPVSDTQEVIVTPPAPKPKRGGPEDENRSANNAPFAEPLGKVGGLGNVLQELRELVELPLKRPELLVKLGLEPPRGVLLVGPPGTGKTLTARCLAETIGVNYIAIAGPEVMGKYYGEAEARLRTIFEKAANSAPCLIFIDEIDSLAPDRSKVEGEVEKRVVAQLLSLMDGFAPNTDAHKNKSVIVLAATNRPNHIDPALRRPGRFDREIQFRVPDGGGREEILQILSRSMPLDSSVNLVEIAAAAVGFVGADLKALCQKAAYIALRRLVPSTQAPAPDIMTVTQADFLSALEEVKPSVLRSLQLETPQVSWEDIGGLAEVKQTLQESVEGQLLYPELYQKARAKTPRGILLWGPPGTGKTLLAKALASQASANFIGISGSELLDRWVGASEQAVRELFAKARQAAPCVVFIDEIDALAPARGAYMGDSGTSDRVVGQLLVELDGLQSSPETILVGATNRPQALDPALMRAGRLDLQLEIDLPNRASRFAILQVHNQDRPLGDDMDLDYWADQTEGWNGADLALLSNQAALEAIRRERFAARQESSKVSTGESPKVSAGKMHGNPDPAKISILALDFNRAYESLVKQRDFGAGEF